MRIVHVIERLSRGGAARSMLALSRHAGGRHVVLSLLPPEVGALALAREAGVEVKEVADADATRRDLADADVVHVHFWNTPRLYAWLAAGELPPARVLLTCHVAGDRPAQVLTRDVVEFADVVALATPYSLRLPALHATTRRVVVIPDAADFERLERVAPARPPADFRVGYVGSVGFVKLHPGFVRMSARVEGATFVVCGGGDAVKTLKREAREAAAEARFQFRGYVDGDLAATLAGFDAFGYPLRADSYAAGELALQEALFAGVPPVVFAHGAAACLVEDGETGRVVSDEDGYVRALEQLRDDEDTRGRLGARARAMARATLGARNVAPLQAALYEETAALPRRERRFPQRRLSGHAGADAFLAALGEHGEPFRRSLQATDRDEVRRADETIARASPVVTDAAAGGVLHYRLAYPGDPYLRHWSGLVLAAAGRPALAAAEFAAARALGLERR